MWKLREGREERPYAHFSLTQAKIQKYCCTFSFADRAITYEILIN